ncbi:5-methylcytosine-specific restriction protein B [Actinoplanes lutulentus]|uniref:Methionyl-tRNA formyltransferase n=1 Tax=Actinoplanes lutulentus TaxID=1287878 RepID=A0A327Z438_9ACTN|nr:hypothetical protein [Actinoplanes lutulentus]MBB2944606.1 5-methylcytosine-specific restriction protein B [Actinoplanes lutulentus]RAK27188.1 hypothetical protein B0I29_12475 [Actinoplanes lutulentus]
MAVIGSFFPNKDSKGGVHRTEVECGWQLVDRRGETLLQLSTYGSEQRQSEKKVSQTIQLDRARAEELLEIMRRAFPGL